MGTSHCHINQLIIWCSVLQGVICAEDLIKKYRSVMGIKLGCGKILNSLGHSYELCKIIIQNRSMRAYIELCEYVQGIMGEVK